MSGVQQRSKGKRFRKLQSGNSNVRERWQFLSAPISDYVPNAGVRGELASTTYKKTVAKPKFTRCRERYGKTKNSALEPEENTPSKAQRQREEQILCDIDGDGTIDHREARISHQMQVKTKPKRGGNQHAEAWPLTELLDDSDRRRVGRTILATEFVERNRGHLWRYGSIFANKSEEEGIAFVAGHKRFRELMHQLESMERKRQLRTSHDTRQSIIHHEGEPHETSHRRLWIETPCKAREATLTKCDQSLPTIVPQQAEEAHNEERPAVQRQHGDVCATDVIVNAYGAVDVDGDGTVDFDEMRINTRLKEVTLGSRAPTPALLTKDQKKWQQEQGRLLMVQDFVNRNRDRLHLFNPSFKDMAENDVVLSVARNEQFAKEFNRLRIKERTFVLKSSMGVAACLAQDHGIQDVPRTASGSTELRRVKNRRELIEARKALFRSELPRKPGRVNSAIAVREENKSLPSLSTRSRSDQNIGLPRLYDRPIPMQTTESFSVTKWMLEST